MAKCPLTCARSSKFCHALHACFIINPNSGHIRRRPGLRDELSQAAAKAGISAVFMLTKAPGHARELARDATTEGFDAVVAVGGDGTINEIASALLGTETSLGVIPMGSGNGLARELRIPLRPIDAVSALRTSSGRTIDSGEADGHPFFCSMGTGFDSELVRLFNQRKQRGLSAYISTGLKLWPRYKERHYSLAVEGVTRQPGRRLIVCVANAAQYGNGALIAPAAKPDDGRLNLVAVPPLSLWNGIPLLYRLFAGSLNNSSHILHAEGTEFVIHQECPGWLHTDGEVYPCGTEIRIRVRPASLRVLCPKAS